MVDMDSLRALSPDDPADPFHAGLGVENLQAIWPQFAARGARWLLLTDAVERPAQRAVYERAVPDAAVIIVRLDVPIDRVHPQLRGREVGSSLEWHLNRSVELQSMMIERGVGDVIIPVDGQRPSEVARLILDAVQLHVRSPDASEMPRP
ncbi:hypothetical protein [Microlunatus endophyticus]|nr:hypothetical protein [Microlunatus endophyticus]